MSRLIPFFSWLTGAVFLMLVPPKNHGKIADDPSVIVQTSTIQILKAWFNPVLIDPTSHVIAPEDDSNFTA